MNEIFQKRGPVDMSPEAIAQRLRELQQLYLFSMSLSRAKFLDASEQAKADAVRLRRGIERPLDAIQEKEPGLR